MIGQLLWVNGRNGRGKYWLIGLCQSIVFCWLSWDFIVATLSKNEAAMSLALGQLTTFSPLLIVSGWFGLVNIIRRYHDRGKRGWWYFIVLIPIIGPIWQLVELGFCRGEDGHNQWGPPPGSASSAELATEIAGFSGSGAMSKLDDNYMADYARKIALQQAETQSKSTPSSFGGGSSAPVFGKR